MKKYLKIIFYLALCFSATSCNNMKNDVDSSQTKIAAVDSSAMILLPSEKVDSIVKLIIDISANDFYKNQKPEPVNFVNVKLKYLKKPNGEELYILCGQFTTSDKSEIQFATVKNSDYEQWIGTSALSFSQDSKEIKYEKDNLSHLLKQKFDSLKK
jgi:predicted small secreted protein